LVTHPPGGFGFANDGWPGPLLGITWVHASEENFISAMVLGGVFERHPTLRFGAIESGGSWIAPLAEYMDFWTSDKRPPSFPCPEGGLTMKPSEYLARNVRVTPFNFEPVAEWMERYPHLQDVYCYSTDYPHPEGREWSLKTQFKAVAPLGDNIIEKFFCTNGALLFP
jgi:hypothetical protein